MTSCRVLFSLIVIQFCFGMEDKLILIDDTIFDENKFVSFDENHPEMFLIQYLSKEDENIFEKRKKLSPVIFNSIKEKSLTCIGMKRIESFIQEETKKKELLHKEIQTLERRLEKGEEESSLLKKEIKQLTSPEEILEQRIQKQKIINKSMPEKKRKKRNEKTSTALSPNSSPFSTYNPNKAILLKKLMRQRSLKNKLELLNNLALEAMGLNHSSSNLNNKVFGPYLDRKKHLLVGKIDNKSLYIFCPCTNSVEVFNEPYAYPPKSINELKEDFSCKDSCPYFLPKISTRYNEHHCSDIHDCSCCRKITTKIIFL